MNSIVIFEAGNQPVQVRVEGETVWLSQAQMAELIAKGDATEQFGQLRGDGMASSNPRGAMLAGPGYPCRR